MRPWWGTVLLLAACDPKAEQTVALPVDRGPTGKREDAPVPIDPDLPIYYPEALANQRLGGVVLLRLFVDTLGAVVKESTQVQESSGYPALDSAALAGVGALRYAPVRRDGVPVAVSFLQPISFRGGSARGAVP